MRETVQHKCKWRPSTEEGAQSHVTLAQTWGLKNSAFSLDPWWVWKLPKYLQEPEDMSLRKLGTKVWFKFFCNSRNTDRHLNSACIHRGVWFHRACNWLTAYSTELCTEHRSTVHPLTQQPTHQRPAGFTLAPSVGTYLASRRPCLHLKSYSSFLITKAWHGLARAAPPQPVQDRHFEPQVLWSRYRQKKSMEKVWCYTLMAKAQKLFVLDSLLQ